MVFFYFFHCWKENIISHQLLATNCTNKKVMHSKVLLRMFSEFSYCRPKILGMYGMVKEHVVIVAMYVVA